MVPWNIPWNIGKRGVEHSVPRNFVAQYGFVNQLIIIVEHETGFRGTFVEHCSTKRYVEYNDAIGAKTTFFRAFRGALREMFHGENPRKCLILCFVWELGNERIAQQKGSLHLSTKVRVFS